MSLATPRLCVQQLQRASHASFFILYQSLTASEVQTSLCVTVKNPFEAVNVACGSYVPF
jgi:hypothetical protein